MNGRASIVASAAGVFLFGLANIAAARDSEVPAKERTAKKACAMGDYEKGADILTDLFIATNDVVYIYNQARCYEQNSLWERAIARFREFLRKANHLNESERAETEQHIAECQAALDRVARPEATQLPGGSVTTAAVATSESPADTPTTSTTTVATTPQAPGASAGRGFRLGGIVSGAVGLAAIGAGVGFAFKTQSISSAEDKNGPTREQEDERKKYETLGWVCYGVGAAALVTGVVLYILGWPTDEPRTAMLLPTVHANGGGLLLRGRF